MAPLPSAPAVPELRLYAPGTGSGEDTATGLASDATVCDWPRPHPLAVALTLCVPRGAQEPVRFVALLDTGADRTVIPAAVAEAVGLGPTDRCGTAPDGAPLYRLTVSVESFPDRPFAVACAIGTRAALTLSDVLLRFDAAITGDTVTLRPRPAGRAESRTERARRVLAHGPRPEDYLEPLPESVARAEAQVKEAREKHGIEVTPEARQWMIDNETLQHHCSGREVLARRTGQGVVVLAVGNEEVVSVALALGDEFPGTFGFEYP